MLYLTGEFLGVVVSFIKVRGINDGWWNDERFELWVEGSVPHGL